MNPMLDITINFFLHYLLQKKKKILLHKTFPNLCFLDFKIW